MKGKHFVFLLGSYAPNYSAVGVCASNIINILKQNNTVTVISIKNEYSLPTREVRDGVEIRRINSKSIKLYNLEAYYNKGIKKYIGKCISLGYRIKQNLNARFCSRLMINKELIDSYLKELNDLISTEKVDCIIGCSFPFESIIAVKELCTKIKTMGIAYLFDPFSDNQRIYRTRKNFFYKFNSNLLFEKDILKKLDLIIAMHTWEKHIKHYYDDYTNIVIAEHPLLLTDNTERFSEYEGRRIMYAGALDPKVRNPNYTFALIEKFLKQSNFVEFNFYTSDYSSQLKAIEQKYPSRFHFHGRKPLEDIHYAEYFNDIMLSIGNSPETSQTPSKIFEYIATGNPIIHIAKYEEDPCNAVLSKYKNAVILYEYLEYNIDEIMLQISKLKPIKNKCHLLSLFEDATPEFVIKKIDSLFN